MLKIGNISFESPVILAPMAGVTDAPYRTLVRRFGIELVFSEMILADSLVHSHKRTYKMATLNENEKPIGVQIVGHCPLIMAKASAYIESQGSACLIDLNMGCPVAKITKSGSGSALMNDLKKAVQIATEVVQATSLPVTAKIRLGWDEETQNYLDFAYALEQTGIKAITLHARTRQQMYSGKANWNALAKLKSSLSIPVIGNGDVTSPAWAEKMIQETGVDGVMVGRAALGKPWLLSDISTYLSTQKHIKKPDILSIVLEHLTLLEEYYGEQKAVFIARKHIAWYSSAFPNGAEFRSALNQIKEPDQVKKAVRVFFKGSKW